MQAILQNGGLLADIEESQKLEVRNGWMISVAKYCKDLSSYDNAGFQIQSCTFYSAAYNGLRSRCTILTDTLHHLGSYISMTLHQGWKHNKNENYRMHYICYNNNNNNNTE